MGITKNRQSSDTIIRMAAAAFDRSDRPQITELTEGMCNAAYLLAYPDGFKTVVKIASAANEGFMTNESCLMESEVRAMQTVAERSDVKVAKVYRYDTSRQLCDGDYFFMQCLDGSSWASLQGELGEEAGGSLHEQVGQIHRKLSHITGEKFCMLGDDVHRFDTLYEFIRFLIKNVLDDAAARDVVIGVSAHSILDALERDRPFFERVTVPTLVHWDMWEGNIFVVDGEVSGIIDWERAMWGEPLMDDRFRGHNRHPRFLKGFGIDSLSDDELRRCCWYDVLLYLTMMTEVTYRQYEDDGQYQWVKPLFDRVWNILK